MSEEIFDLEQAEKLLPRLACLLRNAVDARRLVSEVEREYAGLVKTICLTGGRSVDVAHFSRRKQEKEAGDIRLRESLREIEQHGCVVKDLDSGLLDFPCRVGEREAYLCWRLGEPSIRFWHGTDEGFAGRKPIDEKFLAQLKRPRPV
jgi:hypothetical protein